MPFVNTKIMHSSFSFATKQLLVRRGSYIEQNEIGAQYVIQRLMEDIGEYRLLQQLGLVGFSNFVLDDIV